MQLEWVGHSGQLVDGVSELLDASQLVDVTLMAEGKKLRAHRLILSAASTYFRVRGCSLWRLNVRLDRTICRIFCLINVFWKQSQQFGRANRIDPKIN